MIGLMFALVVGTTTLQAEDKTSNTAKPAPAELDYSPRFLYIGFGFSTTSRAVFGQTFRSYKPTDTVGTRTGPRYRELKDLGDSKMGGVLTFRLRYNDLMTRGERTLFAQGANRNVKSISNQNLYWPAPIPDSIRSTIKQKALSKNGLSIEQATQEVLQEEAVQKSIKDGLLRGGKVDVGFGWFNTCEVTMDLFLDEDSSRDNLSSGLRSQGGLALQGSLSAIGLHLLVSTLSDDNTTFDPALAWSVSLSTYGWLATNLKFGSLQWLAGGGIEQVFVIPGFTSFSREVIVDSKTSIAKGFRSAEFRLGTYIAGFNTPSVRERSVREDDPAVLKRGSYVRVNEFGQPLYDNRVGVLFTADFHLPLSSSIILYARGNVLIGNKTSTWETQIGITISISELASLFT